MIKMKALMSLKATETRKAQKRGASFSVDSEQEARDLERMKQAERDGTGASEKAGGK